jgi:hypothetical protein
MIYIIVLTMSGNVKKVDYRDMREELSKMKCFTHLWTKWKIN